MADLHIELVPCPTCGTPGKKRVVDPLDLKRLREKYTSITRFAASVRQPSGKVGCSTGLIARVESDGHCPDWLLAEYEAIPTKDWPPARPVRQDALERFLAGGAAYRQVRPTRAEEKILKQKKLGLQSRLKTYKSHAEKDGRRETWDEIAGRVGLDPARLALFRAGTAWPSDEEREILLAEMGIET